MAGAVDMMMLLLRTLMQIRLMMPLEATAPSLVLLLVHRVDAVVLLEGDLGEVCMTGAVGVNYTF